jgi:hypothetical protein
MHAVEGSGPSHPEYCAVSEEMGIELVQCWMVYGGAMWPGDGELTLPFGIA